MILPKYFTTIFPEVTDALVNMKKGAEYQTSSGMKKMNQKRAQYGLNEIPDDEEG